jgi:hypothetical protein
VRTDPIYSLVATLFLLAPVCTRCQTLSSWRGVEELKTGQSVNCVLYDQSYVTGRVQSAGPGELVVLAEGRRVVRIEKERARSVLVRRRPRGNQVMWIGLGVGAVGGAAAGAAGHSHTAGGRAGLAGVGAAILAPVGLGVGALLRGQPEYVVVYRAPERKVP